VAIHPSVSSLTVEAIEEYLDVAKYCVDNKKPDGGIYGYPAVLLLFCIVNAIGRSLNHGKAPFRILKTEPFSCRLSDPQIKQLEEWYRNPLVHNGMIAPGACLSPEESGDAFTITSGEPVLIRVKPLYDLVRAAWDHLDKSKMNSRWRAQKKHYVVSPVDLSGTSQSVSATASGSISIPILNLAKVK
jgi:hypothetical protein